MFTKLRCKRPLELVLRKIHSEMKSFKLSPFKLISCYNFTEEVLCRAFNNSKVYFETLCKDFSFYVFLKTRSRIFKNCLATSKYQGLFDLNLLASYF